MSRRSFYLSLLCIVAAYRFASAQSPSVIYTWEGTSNTRTWVHNPNFNSPNPTSFAVLSNTIPGQLTITEVGDEFSPGCTDGCPVGKSSNFMDSGDRIRESVVNANGGLDLTGLQFLEFDLMHNGAGDVAVQPFINTGQFSTYTWFGPGPDYLPSGAPWVIPAGNTPTTVRIPISSLTPAQQAYNRNFGIKVLDHDALGYLTWQLLEVRSVGTPLTSRVLAPHTVGSSENGFNGAFVNFERDAVIGNSGQNQTGLSFDASGTGSLQWTDKGNGGDTNIVSGAAVTWGNGTSLDRGDGPNDFYQRGADLSNYNRVTFRMSATDPLGAGGNLGVQAFFQTGNYVFKTTSGGAVGLSGELNLPIDGQFHDLTFPLENTTGREINMAFGVNLFPHLNDLIIKVDEVKFDTVVGVPGVSGDYNGNGIVDAADYVLWRNGGPLLNEVNAPGTVNAADYDEWRARFGNTTPGSGAAIPEPATLTLVAVLLLAVTVARTRS